MITITEISKNWNLSSFEIKVYMASIAYSQMVFKCYGENRIFLPSVTDPRIHKNWENFENAIKISDGYGISIFRYLQILFYRLKDDSNWKVYPNMLGSKWSVSRLLALHRYVPPIGTNRMTSDSYLNSVSIGRDFIINKMSIMNKDWKYPTNIRDFYSFVDKNAVQPKFLSWTLQGAIPQSYLSISKEFYDFTFCLPKDIQNEYVDKNTLDFLQQKLLNNVDSQQILNAFGGEINTQLLWI